MNPNKCKLDSIIAMLHRLLFVTVIFSTLFIKSIIAADNTSQTIMDSTETSDLEIKTAYYVSPMSGATDFNYDRFYWYEPENTTIKGFNLGIMGYTDPNFKRNDVFMGLELQYTSFLTEYTSDFFGDDFSLNSTELSFKYVNANLLLGYHWKMFGLYCPIGIGGVFYNVDGNSENIENYYARYNDDDETLTKDFTLRNSFAYHLGVGVSLFLPINSFIKFIVVRAEMVKPHDTKNEFGQDTVVDWEWTSEGQVPKTRETGEKSKPLAHLGLFSLSFAF